MNRNRAAELLDAYTKFLLKGGYVDDDVWCEGKTTIDQFMETKWFKDNYPFIPTESVFYKNCKRQRKCEAKICQDCPFRDNIETQEKSTINQGDFHKPRLSNKYKRS